MRLSEGTEAAEVSEVTGDSTSLKRWIFKGPRVFRQARTARNRDTIGVDRLDMWRFSHVPMPVQKSECLYYPQKCTNS